MHIGNIFLLFFEYADVMGMAIVLLVLLLRRDSTILENNHFFLIYYGIFFISCKVPLKSCISGIELLEIYPNLCKIYAEYLIKYFGKIPIWDEHELSI
jgi:hypothetical protein